MCDVSAFAEAPFIVLRATVSPEDEIWVGQRVALHIDVLGRDGWAQIKTIRDFEVPGAYVVRTQTQGVRLKETIDGDSYTGQRYELLIYPQRGGTLTVPSVPVDVELKTWGADADTRTQRMATPQIEFEAKVPPGAEDVRGLVSTTQLTAKQEWNPQSTDFMVGDAIKRTISLEAADVSGMAFMPMTHDPIEGVGVYPEEPSVQDDSHRGTLTGKRSETVAYVFEREGTVELPSIVIQWWKLDTERLMREELEGLTLEVAPNPNLAVGEAEKIEENVGETGRALWVLVPVALLIATIGALWVFRNPLRARLKQWRRERREHEAEYFRRFRRAAASGDPKAAITALMHWLDRINASPGAARLDVFVRNFGDEALLEEAKKLERISVSLNRERWDGAPLRRTVSDARKRWLVAHKRRTTVGGAIPPLNPGAPSSPHRRR